MGEPRTTDDVKFDFAAATDLAAQCRSAKSRVDALHGSRVGWVATASKDFSGYFSRLFADNSSFEGTDASNLCTCLEDVAVKVEKLAELARLENQARARAREWQTRRDQMTDFGRGWNDFWGIDQRPSGTNGPAPTLETDPPALKPRQTPSAGTGSEGGTSSGRPEDLRTFATNNEGADTELDGILAGLRSTEETFQAGCGWGTLSAASVWTGFDSYLAANRQDSTWANTIAAAFEAAGTHGGVATVSDAALAIALAQAGVSQSRQAVDIMPAQMQGMPPSSGFVDDPVNAATGNFIEPESDLAFTGGAVGLAWTRVYNSTSNHVGAFGIGWSSLADSRLDLSDNEEARWWMPEGRLIRFPREGQGWARSVGESYWLADEDGGHRRVITDAEGDRWVFDASGRPLSTSSGPGTRVDLEWDASRLVALVHERGRRLEVDWNAQGTRITSVSAMGRHVTYSYDEAGRLIRAGGGDSGTREYHWHETSDLLARVVDADGVVEVDNTYDEAGRVRTQCSADGRVSRYSYIPGGITEVADQDGTRANTWINDDQGRLIGLIDADGQRQRMAWDRWGRQVMVQDRTGGITVSEYDSRGRMVVSMDPKGVRTELTWDKADRLTEVALSYPEHADSEGVPSQGAMTHVVTRLSYEGDSRDPSLVVDGMGGHTTMDWHDGLLRRLTDPTGVSLSYEYDEHGDLVAVVNDEGGRAGFSYDEAGRPVSFTSPGGATTRFTYDKVGHVTSRVDPDGARWQWEFSPAGRIVAEIDPMGARSSVEYGPNGREASSTDPLGRAIASEWDDLGNLAAVTLPDGRRWGFTHDPLSRLRQVVAPSGAMWSTDFDTMGRPTGVTDPTGRRVSITWGRGLRPDQDDDSEMVDVDALGRPLRVVDNGVSQLLVRNLAGRVVEVVAADGSLTRIQRDAAGRPVLVKSPTGVTAITYDSLGRRGTVTGPSGQFHMSYDADSRLVAMDGPAGTTHYEWDACSRLTRVSTPGTSPTTYRYDAAGRLVTMRDPAWGKRRFTYDEAGQLTSVTNALGGTTTFTYDECARLASETNPVGGVTRNEYTADDLLSAVTDPLGRTWRMGRDAAGAHVFDELPDGTRIDVPRVLDRLAPSETSAASPLVYVHAPDGALVRIEGGSFGTITYEHTPASTRMSARDFVQQWDRDTLGRVTSHQLETLQGRTRTVMGYDQDGRLTRIDVDGEVTAYGYDEAGQLTSIDSAHGRTTHEWDVAGRLIRTTHVTESGSNKETYTYDVAGQLISRTTREGTTSYTYDRVGRRIRQAGPEGETTFTWTPTGRLTSVTGPRGSVEVRLDEAGMPASIDGVDVTWDTATMRPIRIGDASVAVVPGALALGDDLVAHGPRLARHSTPTDPWAATAQRVTDHFGLDAHAFVHIDDLEVLEARVLDPVTCQFLSTDPLSHLPVAPWASTPYSYAANNPLAYTDPNGLKPISDAELDAYNKAHAGIGAQAWNWVKENKDWLIGGALVIAGGILIATGVGGPAGAMLLSAGVDTLIQKATTGKVDYGAVVVSGLLGAVGGGAGAAIAGKFGLSGLRASVTVGATSGAFSGAGTGGYTYMTGPGPHSVGGFLWNTGTGGVMGGLMGAGSAAVGHGFAYKASQWLKKPLLADNRVLSGHGGIARNDGSTFTVPKGTRIRFWGPDDDVISDSLGNAIETGQRRWPFTNRQPRPMESYGPGETVPDYILSPGPDLNIKGNPVTVTSDTRLSTLVSNAPGNYDWAACRLHVDPSIYQP